MNRKNFIQKFVLLLSSVAFFALNAEANRKGIYLAAGGMLLSTLFIVRWRTLPNSLHSLCQSQYLGIAGFLACLCASIFYTRWLPSSMVLQIAGLFGLSRTIFLMICSLVGALVSIPCIAVGIFYLCRLCRYFPMQQIATFFSKYKKPFLMLIAIYGTGMLAILRANFNYVDDMGRVAGGYTLLGDFGRYTDAFLEKIIHADSYLTDVSPLPQLLAIILLSLTGIILFTIIHKRDHYTFCELLFLIPLGLSPYFLQCLSYKYDAPYMALSVLAGVTPALYFTQSWRKNILASFLGILVVCTSYQVSAGIYPMLILFLSMMRWNKKESMQTLPKDLLGAVLGYLGGMLLFYVCIKPSTDSYVTTSIPPLQEIFPTLIQNYISYYLQILKDFKVEWLIGIFVLFLSFILLTISTSKQRKPLALAVTILTLCGMVLFVFSVYPILTDPLTAPRAFYGVGVLISIIGSSIILNAPKKKFFLGKTVGLLLSWAFFVFAFTYGNALYVQAQYTDFRIQQVAENLSELEQFQTDSIKKVQIWGSIGYSPILQAMPQDYKILNRLTPITFRGPDDTWGYVGIERFYGLSHIDCVLVTEEDFSTLSLPLLKDTMYHTIYGDDTHILIALKDGE